MEVCTGTSAGAKLFLGTYEDIEYIPMLKKLVGSASVYVLTASVSTVAEVVLYCQKRNITGVFTTNTTILQKLLGRTDSLSLDNYAGSYIKHPSSGIEFVFINPLKQLRTVTYGEFITRRHISKLIEPSAWLKTTQFKWCMLDASNEAEIYSQYSNAFAIAIDIETLKNPLSIRCVGYTALFLEDSGDITSHSCVIPLDSLYNLALVRKFNWELKAPKIFQNGKYDISYLSRFNAVPYNYLWDTAVLQHCYYSELPKDLATLNAFYVREAMYWKDLAETNDLQEYYRYNALDTWATANVWVAQMLELPQWAKTNYTMEFPLTFPCHLAEMTGMKRDMDRMMAARLEIDAALQVDTISLNNMLGIDTRTSLPFNVNSSPQMKKLLQTLGCADLTSADEKNLAKAAFRHPLNARIIEKIIGVPDSQKLSEQGIRGLRKLKSTYLRTDDDITKTSKTGNKEFCGRILYALNPHGTDTGRLASREHHFWCGLQIQNIPRGKIVKQTIIADEGFLFAEIDLRQAESRDTAYIAGADTLIKAVTGTRDFHSVNASAFFGIPYETIFSDERQKTLNKSLRDLAKRVNHGANYNMGPNVLVETMGLTKIYEAAKLLKLPKLWTPKQIAEHLLAQFHKTYPALQGSYYPSVIKQIVTTSKLVGATGWTRYCFGKPEKSKSQLNAYIAHAPQSLNAQVLNKAWLKVFYEIAVNPNFSSHFKLVAQIHDSILFQYREGHEYLVEAVQLCMAVPVTVTGCDGVTRTFTVPSDAKAGKKYWSELE